jgi:hypothetical protein
MKLSFEMGDSQKHTIEFSWNQILGISPDRGRRQGVVRPKDTALITDR